MFQMLRDILVVPLDSAPDRKFLFLHVHNCSIYSRLRKLRDSLEILRPNREVWPNQDPEKFRGIPRDIYIYQDHLELHCHPVDDHNSRSGVSR